MVCPFISGYARQSQHKLLRGFFRECRRDGVWSRNFPVRAVVVFFLFLLALPWGKESSCTGVPTTGPRYLLRRQADEQTSEEATFQG